MSKLNQLHGGMAECMSWRHAMGRMVNEFNMFYVYILALENKQFYTGYTSDLKRRINEHKTGKSNFTSKHLPLKLIHYECYLLSSDALRREKYLKTTEGKKMLRKQIKDLYDSFN